MTPSFPTLDTDLHAAPGAPAPAAPKRICIATLDVPGRTGNDGLDEARRHLARMLAARSHDVVVACVIDDAADEAGLAETRARYARLGVAVERVAPRDTGKSPMRRIGAPTWALLDWLRARAEPFDLVHVADRHGLGYGPLLAKSLGLALGATHVVVAGAAPTLWTIEGNRQLVSTEEELGRVFLEQRSVELADTVICGSAHLLEWMRKAGYDLPARSFVWPDAVPAPEPAAAAAAGRAARDGAALEEVVFVGRLEPRAGLLLFVDTIDRLVRLGRAPARVTFLGGPSERLDGPGRIQRAAAAWPVEVRTLTDCDADEALAHLSRPGRLAVIPSLLENCSTTVLECLRAGIPFVAAATGGTPELIAAEDRDRALVAPDHVALGDRLAALAGTPLRAVRPRWDAGRTLDVWARWHGQTAPFDAAAERFAARARDAAGETPLVTVCVVHHERPALVRMAVDSVLAQDYPALEPVLVDDGSMSTEARAALDALEAALGARGGRVIRQENRYLGAARNRGAAAARGEWILFLDDDDVLFPDAVSRLVRAARFAGADCVPATSVDFSGDGDPRTDPASCGPPMRHLGPARTWGRVRNVIGCACVLVRRDVFRAAGGFTEAYGVAFEDLEFFNRLILTGRRIAPLPDPVHYYRRHRTTSMMGLMDDRRQAETARARALAPHLERLAADERAYLSYSGALHVARIALSNELAIARRTLLAKLDAAQRTLTGRDRRITTLLARLDATQRTATARQERIALLSARIDAILGSKSWRLTAPLRAVHSWWDGRRRERHEP